MAVEVLMDVHENVGVGVADSQVAGSLGRGLILQSRFQRGGSLGFKGEEDPAVPYPAE